MCNATKDPDATDPVQVSWYYGALLVKPDGENVVINSERNNATGEIHSVLSFYSVNYTNDGVYVCQVFNHPLSFTENKIQLTVECELHRLCKVPLIICDTTWIAEGYLIYKFCMTFK